MVWRIGCAFVRVRSGGWVGSSGGWEESESVGWGVGVDSVAVSVDNHLVVVPAEEGEVVG